MCDERHNAAWAARLREALEKLDAEAALGRDDRSTVTLDQQSVGRLSRMDAMQRQAMAKATERRRGTERRRILAALDRIAEGEFGYCTECGEGIAEKRLEADPTVPTCLSCARG